MRILGLVLAAAGLLWGAPAWAQAPNAKVVATCGAASLPLGQGILQMDQTGKTCGSSGAAANSSLTTLQSGAVADGNGTAANSNGYASGVVTVNCATCSGGTQINFEGSADGTNYAAVLATLQGTTTTATSTTTAGVTVWTVSLNGLTSFRARVSAYSAGTVTATILMSPLGGAGGAGGGGGGGGDASAANQTAVQTTVAPGTAPAKANVGGCLYNSSAPSPTNGQTLALQCDASGNLHAGFAVPQTSSFHFLSAASNNCQVIKNAAGWVWHWRAVNTTTSGVSDLRFYNKATTPVPSTDSALVLSNDPIPIASAANVDGGIVASPPAAQYFSAGISVCLTGANADNDNTNAATGVNVNGIYQ